MTATAHTEDLDEEGRANTPPVTRRSARWLWPMLILLGLGALAVALVFTDDISDGASWKFDTAILLALRVPGHPDTPIGPLWLRQSATDLSALGGFTLQWLLGSAAILYLLSIRRRAEAAWLGASVVGASLANATIKHLLHRPRPQVVPHLAMVDNASFPSGHAMISAAILLTLGAMVAETEKTARARVFLMGFFVFLVVLIGVSRLYLGVHWPTDVLAGWCFGAVWALIVFGANRALRRRTAGKPMLNQQKT